MLNRDKKKRKSESEIEDQRSIDVRSVYRAICLRRKERHLKEKSNALL